MKYFYSYRELEYELVFSYFHFSLLFRASAEDVGLKS